MDLPRLVARDFEQARAEQEHDGWRPGEGAALLLLTPAERPLKQHAWGSLLATAVPVGPVAEASDALGEMEEAIRSLFEGVPSAWQAPEAVYAQLPTFDARANAWQNLLRHMLPAMKLGVELHRPDTLLGDTGAATGPLLLALALRQFADGRHSGPALTWCSDGPSRHSLAYITGPEKEMLP